MRVLVVGAGGVGGYFGSRLAADGNEVVFAARGAHRDAMAADGLRVFSALGDLHLARPQLLGTPASAGLFDIVLLCTKLWDLEAAAEQVRPLLAHDTAVIPLQNGIDSEDRVAALLGPVNVAGGVAYISAHIECPGVIRHVGTMAALAVGELDGSDSWRLEMFQAAGAAAGIDCRVSRDIRRDSWSKFVFLTSLSGATALFRTPIGPILADPERRTFFAGLLGEAAAVARASGVGLADDLEQKLFAQAEKLPGDMKSSMLVDLERGNRLELDWLSGAVSRIGAERGVATPGHDRVAAELTAEKLGV